MGGPCKTKKLFKKAKNILGKNNASFILKMKCGKCENTFTAHSSDRKPKSNKSKKTNPNKLDFYAPKPKKKICDECGGKYDRLNETEPHNGFGKRNLCEDCLDDFLNDYGEEYEE